mmetsp:Transcript_23122/g.33837  ORF Transcript_23122/g.33837 Transcript_23122/m.33837 type:complete len:153 (-) Transcript_23122:190-648(-)|eukprot:CAMPEP_0197247120 /NCGR_PEP_ID=MMETSP1429-20130617/26116_1 /TAXON_ID=49237 /ORGANISM="Chaetoceros  sp., Strain UNC1202" /LENGTH=152 /DNA_ID=CAMNT_0042707951 /DNA_START=53 /DNA_END=511 /DNA_ORIENTATION=-
MTDTQRTASPILSSMSATQEERKLALEPFMTPRATRYDLSSPPATPQGRNKRLRSCFFKNDDGIMPMFLIPLFDEQCETKTGPFRLTVRQRISHPLDQMQSLSVQSPDFDESSHSQTSTANLSKSNKTISPSLPTAPHCKMARRMSGSALAA